MRASGTPCSWPAFSPPPLYQHGYPTVVIPATSRMHSSPLYPRYRQIRQRSLALVAPLSAEDCCLQAMPEASPAKWHLAHTTWFFETFVLRRSESGFRPFAPEFVSLFNSYYNAVGTPHPRPQRGLLSRPDLPTVLAYRAEIDRRMLSLIAWPDLEPALGELIELGLQHEQQHQELLLTDIHHLFFLNPLGPAYTEPAPPASPPPPLRWLPCAGGLQEIGDRACGFAFDNERPRHRVYLAPYQLASRLTRNAEFADFVAAGGYRSPDNWLAEGWDWRQANQRQHPTYWRPGADGGWEEFTLGGWQTLDRQQPVVHLSYYEADAYARWAKARLPSEAEWECAAAAGRADEITGLAWQWTRSAYAPYPGYQPAAGALGEYNGKFMVNQYVLRGSSPATPPGHARPSYRNFLPASACWQVSGLRLARDASGDNARGE